MTKSCIGELGVSLNLTLQMWSCSVEATPDLISVTPHWQEILSEFLQSHVALAYIPVKVIQIATNRTVSSFDIVNLFIDELNDSLIESVLLQAECV